ncbi:hypothetical protein [Spongiibacter tropicus]|uniref:alpha/beta hydrolase family protein n=1 Tax=Spongiibacter tropicus TaxID=454602 RepID=UPI002354072C|nr:hypothetical protein [Spongiibacter tropicus]|tara:strand:- start:8986 stop:10134 length:1149 start_codon:yes stop_codon:yes gene_type:complete
MLKKILIALVILIVAAAIVLRYTERPEPLPAESVTAQWLMPGSYDVSYFDVTLTDDTRATQANGDFAGSDQRLLKTRIWHPNPIHSRAPLIIYSHGFMSTRTGGSYLAEQLASHGYIVAAMDYPLTNFNAPGGPLVKDVVNQPGDIRFLLDQFLSWDQEKGHDFYEAIDSKRIAVMGLSLGGMTSTMAAFHPRMRDPRIAAAISIAGPSNVFAPDFYRQRSLPYMMIASPIDALVNYEDNAQHLPEQVPGATLVSIDKASHTGFADMAKWLRWLDNPDSIGCHQVKQGLEKSEGEDWSAEIGSVEEGILYNRQPRLCELDPLPSAMNPIRQHWLTRAAVFAFLEEQFALGEQRRLDASQFLRQQFPSEQADVHVRFSSPRVP